MRVEVILTKGGEMSVLISLGLSALAFWGGWNLAKSVKLMDLKSKEWNKEEYTVPLGGNDEEINKHA